MYRTFSSCLKNHQGRYSSASVRVSKIYCNIPSCDIWKMLKKIDLATYVIKADLPFPSDIRLELKS